MPSVFPTGNIYIWNMKQQKWGCFTCFHTCSTRQHGFIQSVQFQGEHPRLVASIQYLDKWETWSQSPLQLLSWIMDVLVFLVFQKWRSPLIVGYYMSSLNHFILLDICVKMLSLLAYEFWFMAKKGNLWVSVYLSFDHWFLVDVCTKFEERPPMRSWVITVTRIDRWTDNLYTSLQPGLSQAGDVQKNKMERDGEVYCHIKSQNG